MYKGRQPHLNALIHTHTHTLTQTQTHTGRQPHLYALMLLAGLHPGKRGHTYTRKETLEVELYLYKGG
jgi:hypothetical protein